MNDFFNKLKMFYNEHPLVIIFLLILMGLTLILPIAGIKITLMIGGIICMIAAFIMSMVL